jgi:uncharacterized protein (TIGR04255 family)
MNEGSLKLSMRREPLPSYKKPPIDEVVCGMQFQTPDKLRIPHIGLLWEKLRDEYPNIQHVQPIATIQGAIPVDEQTGLPLHRIWFINESDDQLVQFQFDRIYFNWRRRQDDYPRYEYVIQKFKEVIDTVENFFASFQLGELKAVQYELTYINHIPKGKGWTTLEDLPNVFQDFHWCNITGRFLPAPTHLAWKTNFELPEKKGNLTVDMKEATHITEKIPLFVFTLRAIGGSENAATFREWFDTAHEWIVRGFTDLTTPAVHRIWERE